MNVLKRNSQHVVLGCQARDKVTGFDGVVIGYCRYLFGCAQWGITPPAKDGDVKGTQWFDEGRVEFVDSGVAPEDVRTAVNGGPNRDAPA